MYFKQEIGKNGETLAEDYLKMKGYEILEKNFCCSRGEIDIIARKNKEIVFLEIKSRNSTKYGLPAEAVTEKKLKHICRTAEYYLILQQLKNQDVRIDVIEVYIEENRCIINHLKQVI